ncbi:MAG: arsenate reductase family protein [Spirochaetota bacterium]
MRSPHRRTRPPRAIICGMTTQLIGTKKSKATQKAERYLKERGIEFQFVDLTQRGLSAGELDRIAEAAGGHEALIDTESKAYTKRGMQYMDSNAREELLEDPGLLRMPIVRGDGGVAVEPDEAELKRVVGR